MASTTAGRAGEPPSGPRGDRFLDVVVLLCVALFVILAAGVGVLALQLSLH